MKKETKKCTECQEPIIGRVDKKFCSDQCRNTYNNRNNSDSTNLVRNVNNVLRKNRRILHELNPEGKARTHRNKLNELGFNFNYFTSQYKTQKGVVYYFCYEYGYLPIENDFFLLVKQREDYEKEKPSVISSNTNS
jgi:predicted nucleic acid-binding Zn ribbon protein